MATLLMILGIVSLAGFLCLLANGTLFKPEDLETIRKTWRLLHAERCEANSCFAILTVETPNGIRRFHGRCHYRDAETSAACSTQQMKVLEEFWQKADSEGKFDE